MSNYLNSNFQERVELFDSYVSEADEALRKPAIIDQLGERAVSLLDANSRLFLPNIQHGKIEIPKRYRDKNSIGFLPVFSSVDNAAMNVSFGRSFYEASAQRKDVMLEGYKVGFGNDDANVALELDIEELIEEGFVEDYKAIGPEIVGEPLGELGVLKTRAFTTAIGQIDLYEDFPSHFAARPFIAIFDHMIAPEENRKSSALSHELFHAVSVENRTAEKSYAEHALEELTAYYISFIINTYFDTDNPSISPSVVEVERFRKKHNIGINDLSISDEQIIELEKIGAISRPKG